MVTSAWQKQPWVDRLYLPAYSIKDAARYVGARRSTVYDWYRERGRFGPALPRRRTRRPISYLELIELAVVATFRAAGVRLETIRRARAYLVDVLGLEYPFAQVQLKTDGANILMEWREKPDEEIRDRIIRVNENGQIVWTEQVKERLDQFCYLDHLAITWRPLGPASRVIIDPRVSFGSPSVRGIPTWVIKERALAKEPVEFIAEDFGLDVADVREALLFEGVVP